MAAQLTQRDYNEHHDFYLPLPDYVGGGQKASIQTAKATPEDTGIRLFCRIHNTSWGLQIRGFFQDRNYNKGKTWYYAHANLGVEGLKALRDACNEALAEIESTTDET